MIFILDSNKPLYQKTVNCNGAEMSLKRYDGEILLGFTSKEQSEIIILADDELRLVYNQILTTGSRTHEPTGLNVSVNKTHYGWRLAFLSFKDENFESVNICMNNDELRYLKILLTEKL